jgi:hypothetical protein
MVCDTPPCVSKEDDYVPAKKRSENAPANRSNGVMSRKIEEVRGMKNEECQGVQEKIYRSCDVVPVPINM